MRNPRKITAAKRVQYGALPYRLTARSRPQFMLVTSRETRRWIIPKGWPTSCPIIRRRVKPLKRLGSWARLLNAPLVHSHMKSSLGAVALSSAKCASFPLKSGARISNGRKNRSASWSGSLPHRRRRR